MIISYTKFKVCLITLVVLYIAYIQFYNLGNLYIVQWDESRLAVNAAEMSKSGNWCVTTYEGNPDYFNTKPPLMIWLQTISIYVFGLSEFAIRLPSAFAGFATIILLGIFCFKLTNNVYFGIFASLLLTVSNGFIQLHGSITGDYDALLTFFILGSLYFFYQYIQSNFKRDLHFMILFLALAILTKSAAAIIFIPIYGLIFWWKNGVKKSIKFGLYLLISLIPFFIFCTLRENANHGYLEAIWKNDFGGRFGRVDAGHSGEWYYYLENLYTIRYTFFIWLWPFSLIFLFLKGYLTEKIFLSITLLFLLIISISQTKIHWYDTPVLPIISTCIVLFLAFINKKLLANWKKQTFTIVLCLSMSYSMFQKYEFTTYRKGMLLSFDLYELSALLKNYKGNENLNYIANNYDAEYYFYTLYNPKVKRNHYDSLNINDLVAMGNIYKDSVKNKYQYITLDSSENAKTIRIIGYK